MWSCFAARDVFVVTVGEYEVTISGSGAAVAGYELMGASCEGRQTCTTPALVLSELHKYMKRRPILRRKVGAFRASGITIQLAFAALHGTGMTEFTLIYRFAAV